MISAGVVGNWIRHTQRTGGVRPQTQISLSLAHPLPWHEMRSGQHWVEVTIVVDTRDRLRHMNVDHADLGPHLHRGGVLVPMGLGPWRPDTALPGERGHTDVSALRISWLFCREDAGVKNDILPSRGGSVTVFEWEGRGIAQRHRRCFKR